MIKTFRYTTADVSPEKRLKAWRDGLAATILPFDVVPLQNDRMFLQLTEKRFDLLSIVKSEADGSVVETRQEALRNSTQEYFFLMFPIRSPYTFRQRGREGVVRPGQVALFCSNEPLTLAARDQHANFALKIQCDALRERIPCIDDCCARMNIANPLLLPVVSQLGTQLLKMDEHRNAQKLESALVDLAGLMLETKHPVPLDFPVRQTLAEITFERLSAYLRENYADIELSPARVAQMHRISLRHLQRIFQMHGLTFGQALMEIRMMEAQRWLTAQEFRCSGLTIAEVAFRCGFSSQAHFSTKFREYFGCTPRSAASNGGIPGQCVSAPVGQGNPTATA